MIGGLGKLGRLGKMGGLGKLGKLGCLGLIGILGAMLVAGCGGPKGIVHEVPVYVHDTTFVNHTDSVNTVDSIVVEREIIVREADSAILAEYGLKLKEGERTILVLRRELERQKNLAASKTTDTAYKTVEKPVPVTKYVEVERELTWWQMFLMWVGRLGLLGGIGILGVLSWKKGWWKKIYKTVKGWIKR